ncbi:MAG: GNAT family N-acetyltransferase [Candidatus Thermoplasmatota archaeon]|nr:GNAT family N-acetyltransferase [Candidatus Thermoplasmatota archaeon]
MSGKEEFGCDVSGIAIRRLPASRWEDYRRLRLTALGTDPAAFGSSVEEEETYGMDAWQQRIGSALFALSGDVPVGMISLVFRNRIKTSHAADIFGMFVDEHFRGKGVGEALLKSAITLASAGGEIVKIALMVNPAQNAAFKLYEKHGFAVVGKLKKELKVDGLFHDTYVMEKFL